MSFFGFLRNAVGKGLSFVGNTVKRISDVGGRVLKTISGVGNRAFSIGRSLDLASGGALSGAMALTPTGRAIGMGATAAMQGIDRAAGFADAFRMGGAGIAALGNRLQRR